MPLAAMTSATAGLVRTSHDETVAVLAEAITRHRDEPLGPLLSARGVGPYRGYAEILDALLRLGDRGCRLSQIGRSVRGQPIVAVSLGTAELTARTRTSVIVAGLHPIEWIGVETALTLLEALSEDDLGDRAVLAVPLANPDGLVHVERNLRRGRRRFVRHNAHGVDLNRNFDSHWGRRSALARLIPWVFKPGGHPASEPEVAAIAYALGARRVDRALSLHSFGGVVLYPSSHFRRAIGDVDDHRRWARRIGAAASERPYRALSSAWFGLGMTMGGLELDWFHERHGALSLLVECSRGGIAPSLARLRLPRLLDPFSWFNPPEPDEVAGRIASACLPFVRGDRI
jgi:hypothetical protein